MSQTLETERILTDKSSDAMRKSRPVTLDGPRKSIRSELFQPNTGKAIRVLFVAIAFQLISYAVIYFGIKFGQSWLLGIGWILTSMSVTSLFVIGHDCAHASFLKNNRVNDFIGHIAFLFSFYPYYAWKYTHNAHHAHTNDLTSNQSNVYFDNAWLPFTVSEYKGLKENSKALAFLYQCTRYFPPIGSLLHNFVFHTFPSKFIESHRKKVYVSYAVLLVGLLTLGFGFYLLTGVWIAFIHFLIIPGLLFQFWMSFYTFLHHTSTEIAFYKKEEWTPYLGQIVSTYNSLAPKWLSFIHFHIDIHTPHHLSTAIPCYHLPAAYADLKHSVYAEDLKEGKFEWKYMQKQIMECHVWDEVSKRYLKFSDVED